MIVGISGKATAGKSAVAARLADRWGFAVVSFADALREEVLARFPLLLRAIHDMVCGGHNPEDCIRRMVYEVKPRGIRELLQEYGSEVRRADQPDYWIERWSEGVLRSVGAAGFDYVATPDVRFENEARAVLRAGGVLWRIERPNHPEIPGSSHASETVMDAWDRWDEVIRNDGTLADLHAAVDALASGLEERAQEGSAA
jgi:hypothetical protein